MLRWIFRLISKGDVPSRQRRVSGGDSRLDRGIVDPRRGTARRNHGGCGVESGAHAVASLVQSPRQHHKLGDLLHGERQPAPHFGIEIGFPLQIDRRVQQRA